MVCRGHALCAPTRRGQSSGPTGHGSAACCMCPVLDCLSVCHLPTCLLVCLSVCLFVTLSTCMCLAFVCLCIFFIVCVPKVHSETLAWTDHTSKAFKPVQGLSAKQSAPQPHPHHCSRPPAPSPPPLPRPSDNPSTNFRRDSCQSPRSPHQFTLTRSFSILVLRHALRGPSTHVRTHAPVGATLAERVAAA